jgi:hypothetical protein
MMIMMNNLVISNKEANQIYLKNNSNEIEFVPSDLLKLIIQVVANKESNFNEFMKLLFPLFNNVTLIQHLFFVLMRLIKDKQLDHDTIKVVSVIIIQFAKLKIQEELGEDSIKAFEEFTEVICTANAFIESKDTKSFNEFLDHTEVLITQLGELGDEKLKEQFRLVALVVRLTSNINKRNWNEIINDLRSAELENLEKKMVQNLCSKIQFQTN